MASQLDDLRLADTRQLRGDLIDQGNAKLQQLNYLRDQLVGGANGLPPAAIRAIIASAIADARACTMEVRGAAGLGAAEARAALQSASEAARAAVSSFEDDYFGKRIFDPYLRFASAKDEEAYRQREQERQRAITEALAEGTPEGNLRANELALEQLHDAGAHGADRSPQYQPELNSLESSRRRLTSAIAQAHDDSPPVQAEAPPTPESLGDADPSIPSDVLATLRAASVSAGDHTQQGHGVTAQAVTQANLRIPG